MVRRLIGYWRGTLDDGEPDPRAFIDPGWDEHERAAVADYLRHGRYVCFYMGKARCRLCGAWVGSGEQADDAYQWPEGLEHYVMLHGVRLPTEFVEHVLRVLAEDERAEPADRTWWRAQQGTGTSRSWSRWVVRVSPEATSELARWAARSPFPASLVTDGSCEVGNRTDAELLRQDLESLAISCTITEESVAAPEKLFA